MSIKDELFTVVGQSGPKGITAAEIEALPLFANTSYHGPVSGNLSHLHRNGQIVRLAETRVSFLNGKDRKFKIYVLPGFVNSRPTEPQGR